MAPALLGRVSLAMLLASLLGLSACATQPTLPDSRPAPPPKERLPQRVPPCAVRTVQFAYTTDEHGWLLPDPVSGHGGVVQLYHTLHARHGRLLPLLSGGDMWTGPYPSTLTQGADMAAAMGVLGYRAAAVGNHEFDFGQDVLKKRAALSHFPLLAANVTVHGEALPGVRGHAVVDIDGLRVGVIGLATPQTPETTDRNNVNGVVFSPLIPAMRTEAAALRAQNVDATVVLVHDAWAALGPAFQDAATDEHVAFIGFGHHHKRDLFAPRGKTPACNPGAFLRGFCEVTLTAGCGHPATATATIVDIQDGPAVASGGNLKNIVQSSMRFAENMGGEVLATLAHGLPRADKAAARFVATTWLDALPEADVAITNVGGVRQDLPPGPVKVKDVVSLLPFENRVVLVQLTEAALDAALSHPEAAWARRAPRGADDAQVTVAINGFMSRGGDGFVFDAAHAVDGGLGWRDPVIAYLRRAGACGAHIEPNAYTGAVLRGPPACPTPQP